MNIALWAIQIVLATVFAGSGILKATQTKQRMIAIGQTGVAPFPLPVIRVIAVLELLAAAALVVPRATGIVPTLTPLAACGLAVLMIGAGISHASLREYKQVFAVNLVLLLSAVFVAVGRF